MIKWSSQLQPLWLMKISGAVGDRDVADIAELVRAMHASGEAVLLVDANEAGLPSVFMRSRLRELTEANIKPELTLAVSVVIDAPLLRGAATAIVWAVPGASHVRFVRTLEKALLHLRSRAPHLVAEDVLDDVVRTFEEQG